MITIAASWLVLQHRDPLSLQLAKPCMINAAASDRLFQPFFRKPSSATGIVIICQHARHKSAACSQLDRVTSSSSASTPNSLESCSTSFQAVLIRHGNCRSNWPFANLPTVITERDCLTYLNAVERPPKKRTSGCGGTPDKRRILSPGSTISGNRSR